MYCAVLGCLSDPRVIEGAVSLVRFGWNGWLSPCHKCFHMTSFSCLMIPYSHSIISCGFRLIAACVIIISYRVGITFQSFLMISQTSLMNS